MCDGSLVIGQNQCLQIIRIIHSRPAMANTARMLGNLLLTYSEKLRIVRKVGTIIFLMVLSYNIFCLS